MLDAKRITTFVVGGIAGGAAALLLSPRSGRELRNSIALRLEGWRERGEEGLFDVRERVAESGRDVFARRGDAESRSESVADLRERLRQTRIRLQQERDK